MESETKDVKTTPTSEAKTGKLETGVVRRPSDDGRETKG